MAAPPVKSQPLHNFPLSQLRWAHKKSSSSAAGSGPHHHRSRPRDSPDQDRRRDSPDQDRRRCPDPETPDDSPPKETVLAAAVEEEEDENEEAKSWNLRPRKEVARVVPSSRKETSCAEKNDKRNTSNCSVIKSQRLRGMVEEAHNGGGEREGKRKVWISLSKEEIEEDIYVFTGSKPSRRPRKWPRNVQKQLDNIFPGMYLVGVSADSYGVMMS